MNKISCNYFKLSFISILLCILIITHKFSLEKIYHNKTNRFDIINATLRRLQAESHKTHIFKTHSGENSLTYPIDNKSDKNNTEYYEASSDCTFSDKFPQNFFHQKEQIEWKNKNDSKSIFQKLHQKLHFRKLPIIATTMYIYFFYGIIFAIVFYVSYYIYMKNKKKFNTN
ncbi:Plasmodium exported protein (hyp10), unknown function [Plasmodium reichenowi]|uniref:Uncharacterized protein n=1 Tax=Plasmodium reichenowi TaxID=5854 RepID=A0A2P9DCI5_PLARE|nr:Plasmodium exported protein (hyp10), unknown function [Plasmodium reichenowi]